MRLLRLSSGAMLYAHLMTIVMMMVVTVLAQTISAEDVEWSSMSIATTTTTTIDPLGSSVDFGALEELLNHTANSADTDQVDLKKWLIAYYNLDPNVDWRLPRYFSKPYQLIGTLFQGVIFIVGKLAHFEFD